MKTEGRWFDMRCAGKRRKKTRESACRRERKTAICVVVSSFYYLQQDSSTFMIKLLQEHPGCPENAPLIGQTSH
jgi:hypothetical protein